MNNFTFDWRPEYLFNAVLDYIVDEILSETYACYFHSNTLTSRVYGALMLGGQLNWRLGVNDPRFAELGDLWNAMLRDRCEELSRGIV